MDHSKFEYLVKGLTGKVIVEKLTEDFEILDRFLIIKKDYQLCLMNPMWIEKCR